MLRKLWNDQAFRHSLLGSVLWSLMAHAYMFLHSLFSHDALNALYASPGEEVWKVELGRFLFPVYRALFRGQLLLPWVVGLFFTLWLALTVYLLCKLFNLKFFWPIFLTAGVLAVNKTVIALSATYLYELDIDMLSVLFATLAVYLWKKYKFGFLWGSLCLLGTLGIYQCNLSVAVVLVIFVSVLELLYGEDGSRPDARDTSHSGRGESSAVWLRVLLRGLLAIAMILLAGLLYVGALKASLAMAGTHLVTDKYNSLTNMLAPGKNYVRLLINAYRDVKRQFQTSLGFFAGWVVLLLRAALALFSLVLMIRTVLVKKPGILNVVLAGVLLLLLPLGMNFSYILNNGRVHDLMRFALWLLGLLPVILLENLPEDKRKKTKSNLSQSARSLAFFLLFLLLFNNVITANAIYLKKDFEQQQTMSLMTRVMDDLNDAAFGPGSAGQEADPTSLTLCFIGGPQFTAMPGFEPYISLTGVRDASPIPEDTSEYYYNVYKAYLT